MSSPRSTLGPAIAVVVLTAIALVLGVVGRPAPAQAAPRTTVSGWASAPSSVATKATYVARVRVSGGARLVQLQRKVGARWTTVDTTRATRTGKAILTWRAPAKAGKLSLRVRVPKAGARPAATTSARVLRVRAKGVALPPLLAQVLALVNEARAEGATCGGTAYPPRPALRAHVKLGNAAQRFAKLMGDEEFFSHTSPDGSDPGDRITAAGYSWSSYGENIAAGYTSAASVVAGWLASAGHCRNIMGAFTEIGLGHAYVEGSPYGHYWVQDFATPQ